MKQNGRKIIIIGGGIAGLCTAVYALKCGYQVEVLEMHDIAGGLAMNWRRGHYTFETCLHWLLGSKPGGEMHAQWQDIFDIDQLTFVDYDEFVRIENENGDKLSVFTNIDRLEAEWLDRAPQDSAAIREFTHDVRALGKFRLLEPNGGLIENWFNMLLDAPILPLMVRLAKLSGSEYGSRFTDPLLRSFFAAGEFGKLSAIALVLSMAWMNSGNAGYAIGGAQAIIRLIEDQIAELGGKIAFQSRVERILVENAVAVGVQLENGKILRGDWVISAADGHETIFDLLDGRFVDASIRKTYQEYEPFPSYVQVSLGVGLDLSTLPPMITRSLDRPIEVDPGTWLDFVGFRIFNFDPTFAPPGKTAVTSVLMTRNFSYWADLRQNDPAGYRAEKDRVAQSVIAVLEKRLPGVREKIEVIDVATPATVIRYTSNWKGSIEGWLVLPGSSLKPLPNTLPGLQNFFMVGQWIMPGGGLPSGLMTARAALKSICKSDHVPFEPHSWIKPYSQPVGV